MSAEKIVLRAAQLLGINFGMSDKEIEAWHHGQHVGETDKSGLHVFVSTGRSLVLIEWSEPESRVRRMTYSWKQFLAEARRIRSGEQLSIDQIIAGQA